MTSALGPLGVADGLRRSALGLPPGEITSVRVVTVLYALREPAKNVGG
jgi:hypothetical protein